jgi:hypothetical protein
MSEQQTVDSTLDPTPVPYVPTAKAETLGGIIDRDFIGRRQDPIFSHVGSMGGQNVYDCDQCGGLVREDRQNVHSAHHAVVNGAANRVGVQAG